MCVAYRRDDQCDLAEQQWSRARAAFRELELQGALSDLCRDMFEVGAEAGCAETDERLTELLARGEANASVGYQKWLHSECESRECYQLESDPTAELSRRQVEIYAYCIATESRAEAVLSIVFGEDVTPG